MLAEEGELKRAVLGTEDGGTNESHPAYQKGGRRAEGTSLLKINRKEKKKSIQTIAGGTLVFASGVRAWTGEFGLKGARV